MHHVYRAATGPKAMLITSLWPQTPWSIVWKNLGEAPVPGATKAAWYKVVHDILPTNERLYRICTVPSMSEAVPPSATRGRAMPWWQGSKICAENAQGRTHSLTVLPSVGTGNKYGHGQSSVWLGYYGQSRSGYPARGSCVPISHCLGAFHKTTLFWLTESFGYKCTSNCSPFKELKTVVDAWKIQNCIGPAECLTRLFWRCHESIDIRQNLAAW